MSPARCFALLASIFLFPGDSTAAQAAAPDSATVRARRAFDFLIGSWVVIGRSDGSAPAPGEETMAFEKTLDGAMISARWRFNRGTPAAPDFVNAAYVSGYDNRSGIWSFYYVSPQSAQYWPGEPVANGWRFTKIFPTATGTLQQRQWWEAVDGGTIRRHIDNSTDEGKSWTALVITLRRR